MLNRHLVLIFGMGFVLPAAHGGQPELGLPLLKKAILKKPIILDKEFSDADKGKEAKVWLDRSLSNLTNDESMLPGFIPMAVGKKLLYRGYVDVRATNLEEGKDDWGNLIGVGAPHFATTEMDGGLAVILNNDKLRANIESWLTRFRQASELPFLFENTIVGTLSHDDQLFYVVDDLAVPVPPSLFRVWDSGVVVPDLKLPNLQNCLYAFELSSGKVQWRLNDLYAGKKAFFANSHFLGPPLSVAGKLYVLNEKNSGPTGEGELRLVTINPAEVVVPAHEPKLIPPILALGNVPEERRFTHDLVRRTTALQLAHAKGILVCSTNAGSVFGIELGAKAPRLLWAHKYKEFKKPAKGKKPRIDRPDWGMSRKMEWRASGLVITQDKVLFAAPDDGWVRCVHLKDGRPLWKAARNKGLYLAGVFGDRVLVIDSGSCRALKLADGTQLWEVPTGVPCGRGAARGDLYYLPLRKRAASDKPGICVIDVARGKLLGTAEFASGELPGNLVIHRGMLISQSATQIAAYPLPGRK